MSFKNGYYNKYIECKNNYLKLKYQTGGGVLKDNLITVLGFDEEKATYYERELDPQETATHDSLDRLFGEVYDMEKQFTVYTTGLGYGLLLVDKYIILKNNIMKQLGPHYNNIIFKHYDDMGFNLYSRNRIQQTSNGISQEFYKQNLDLTKCREIEKEINNHLIIDMANIFKYGFNKFGSNKAIVYYESDIASATSMTNDELNLNVFYPGYLLDYSNDDFISNFRYIHINNNNIFTYIDKIVIFRLDLSLTVNPLINETSESISLSPKKKNDRAIIYIPRLSQVYDSNISNNLIWRE